jgi:hypothetical protein
MPKLIALALIAAVCAPSLLAQTRVSIASSRPATVSGSHVSTDGGAHRSTILVGGRGMHRHSFSRPPFFYGYGDPYFYSDYYPPYEDEQYARPEPPPQPAPPPVQVKNEPLPDPVLLELRGNQWVRVTDFAQSSTPTATPEAQTQPETAALQSEKMLPAVLVYRDGHTEEISSYSIIGNTIYAKSDYWSKGAWTKNIQIADLDLPATLRENQQRGVKFELPSGPNEVMIRP